ncbi:hypothetical protein [Nocardia aurantia]|uniref:hypothetical protein n=1 Tax=Nocardia aurantia TaxID=2585199 RepID=UPI001D10C17D|nr:hypothetical protein [Nocardia aurantia]
MTARVGAVHLGWDVVSVAAGGGGIPIRPVQVEGTFTPPAYLLADSTGRLHTAGTDVQRPDLGIAVSDVRDILGHLQIRIAGATWPAELVFRARLYNPLAAVGKHLRGKPDVIALPFPDDWPDGKVEEYCRLVELLDVETEPLPESVALSGYMRALGLVEAPQPGRAGMGATGVYSDGRSCLVVAVHGDDEQPTESVGVPISLEATRDAHAADNVVIEVMAAARAMGADTSTVLLSGNACFNDALRLAFQNHLGHRLQIADHPMHALVLGAAHLLVTDSERSDAFPPAGPPGGSGSPRTGGAAPATTTPANRPDPGGRPAAGGQGPVAGPGASDPGRPTTALASPGAMAAMHGMPMAAYGPHGGAGSAPRAHRVPGAVHAGAGAAHGGIAADPTVMLDRGGIPRTDPSEVTRRMSPEPRHGAAGEPRPVGVIRTGGGGRHALRDSDGEAGAAAPAPAELPASRFTRPPALVPDEPPTQPDEPSAMQPREGRGESATEEPAKVRGESLAVTGERPASVTGERPASATGEQAVFVTGGRPAFATGELPASATGEQRSAEVGGPASGGEQSPSGIGERSPSVADGQAPPVAGEQSPAVAGDRSASAIVKRSLSVVAEQLSSENGEKLPSVWDEAPPSAWGELSDVMPDGLSAVLLPERPAGPSDGASAVTTDESNSNRSPAVPSDRSAAEPEVTPGEAGESVPDAAAPTRKMPLPELGPEDPEQP